MSGMHLSKEFFELLKAIGESKSKQEEDRIILREVTTLKRKLETGKGGGGGGGSKGPSLGGASFGGASLGGPGGVGAGSNSLATNKKKAKEFLVRLLYVEMLGHDGSFGYIKALELAASSSIVLKKTGYLVCGSCLSPEHEFRFMLVNQMQRDLSSSNVLEVGAALVAASDLITSDMVPAVQGEVTKLLDHSSETVRKKAILTMHRFHQIAPDTVTKSDLTTKLRRVLCDRDPCVMGSSLNAIEALATVDPHPFKDLVPSLVSILKQICEHRLPSDYDYHRVPAPWIQMKIVRILAVLGKNDMSASSGMYEILSDCMKKADVGINAGYAVVYECVRTVTAIYPNPTLLDAAAEAISRFIASRSQNLKYLGLTGLAGIVESHPQYAAAHQLAVIECLEDRDETLQRKTLDLLYRMTNPVNVEFITEKLLAFLRGTTDVYLRKTLTARICRIAERYAPTNAWYIKTVTELFEIGGDLVGPDVAQNLMTLIAEGAGEGGDGDEEADMLLRQNAVEVYASLLDRRPRSRLPRVLLETMAWVLGEYGYLSAEYALDNILSKLCDTVHEGKMLEPSTRRFLMSAVFKLVAQAGTCPPHAARLIDECSRSKDAELQQRCLEFQALLTTAPHLLGEVLPVDASCEDVDVDVDLPFLDTYVSESIANGAREYDKPEDDDDDDYDGSYGGGGRRGATKTVSAFKMTPYEKPTAPSARTFGRSMAGMGAGGGALGGVAAGVTPPPSGYGGGVADGVGYQAGGAASAATATAGGGANPGGEPQLVLRSGAANVWGKGGLAQPAAAAPGPASSSSVPANRAPAPAPAPASAWSQTTTFGGAASAPAASPAKTEEQLRREREAAALFGGPTPAPSSAALPPPNPVRAARAAVPAPAPAPAPAPVPPPAPAPAPEIDLLDMNFDAAPAPAGPSGGTASSSAETAVDIFSSNPTPIPEQPPEREPEPAPPAVAASEPDDPFAASGLLGDVLDKPLSDLMVADRKFEYGGQKMAPLPITTAEFGGKWGACPATSPFAASSTKIVTLDAFMNLCVSIGAHKVEAIAATNEGICAGMVGGSILILIHGKVTPQGDGGSRIDATIKTTDSTLGGVLAMYMQNMMR